MLLNCVNIVIIPLSFSIHLIGSCHGPWILISNAIFLFLFCPHFSILWAFNILTWSIGLFYFWPHIRGFHYSFHISLGYAPCFHPLFGPPFTPYPQSKEILLNLSIKCYWTMSPLLLSLWATWLDLVC